MLLIIPIVLPSHYVSQAIHKRGFIYEITDWIDSLMAVY